MSRTSEAGDESLVVGRLLAGRPVGEAGACLGCPADGAPGFALTVDGGKFRLRHVDTSEGRHAADAGVRGTEGAGRELQEFDGRDGSDNLDEVLDGEGCLRSGTEGGADGCDVAGRDGLKQ